MSVPRLVVVRRRTWLAELLEAHSTPGAVEFFPSGCGLGIKTLRAVDEAQRRTLDAVSNAVPAQWRYAEVERGQLSRFLFELDDLVVVVGQDGLIPNIGKYLRGQPMLGTSPGAPGVLCSHSSEDLWDLLAGRGRPETEIRTMAEAIVDDRQRLRTLNEILAGNRGHQFARYDLRVGGSAETQSSSGVVVGAVTGAGEWLASLWGQNRPGFGLPGATFGELAYFARGAWPSGATGTSLTTGLLAGGEGLELSVHSTLVAFGGGIERNFLRLEQGQGSTVRGAEGGLKLMRLKQIFSMTNRSVALVTGTTRGIGRAIATELFSTHQILVGGRDAARTGELVAELDDAAPFICDLADEGAVAAACAGIGQLDVLVHSAGIGRSNGIGPASRALWREVFKTNVFAVTDFTRLPLPTLEAARGIVVAINPGVGSFSSPGEGVYAGSKFALRVLTGALREEMCGKVRICSIHPGWTDTDMQRELQVAMGNEHYNGSCYVSPGSVAAAVRLAVDTPDGATAEQLSIRPSVF